MKNTHGKIAELDKRAREFLDFLRTETGTIGVVPVSLDLVPLLRQVVKEASFPAIVIKPDGFILAGNQRTDAARLAGLTTVDAYVVEETDPQKIEEFIRRDNTRHGKNTTDEERIQTCVEMHQKFGCPFTELNDKFFGGSQKMYWRITQANSASEVANKLKTLHVHAILPNTTLLAMHPVIDMDKVLCETYKLSADFGYTAVHVSRLVEEILGKGSEKERLDLISAKRREASHRAKTGIVRKDASYFRKHLSSWLDFLQKGNDGVAFPPIDRLTKDLKEKTEMKALIERVISALKPLKEKSR